MTTEQMDFIDDEINAGRRKPYSEPWDQTATCDWGSCDGETFHWRFSPELKRWLGVCERHSEDYQPRWRKLLGCKACDQHAAENYRLGLEVKRLKAKNKKLRKCIRYLSVSDGKESV